MDLSQLLYGTVRELNCGKVMQAKLQRPMLSLSLSGVNSNAVLLIPYSLLYSFNEVSGRWRWR